MKWITQLPRTLLALVTVGLGLENPNRTTPSGSDILVSSRGWTHARKVGLREEVRTLWYHGFDNYMRYAFPLDELMPISCMGRGPDWHNPAAISYNDVNGNFSLTLLDTLDTFVVLNDTQGFENAVRNVLDWVSFDVNTKPQLFETNIRVLGGLLSAHIYANKTGQPFFLPWYRGELLHMAHDLGSRLLPAFLTPTGMPYARINLRHGVPKGESIESCTAGAGSLILEFGVLSRLTGDDRFEKAAYKAFFALWNRRSDIGLVGNTVNVYTGTWLHPDINGVGAGIDSFYEYALKWYILSGDVEFLDVWQESYASVMRYTRASDGYWYRSVNINTGDASYYTVDSLSAFWPGLQVLSGDIENAIKAHMVYWNIWRGFSGMPEVWDMKFKVATSLQYPLRPEFVESTWYLYRATKDPFYLDVAERIFRDLTMRSKVECGLAGISDLRTNKQDDRMESFVLSETLKYLYLLFDEENPLNHDDSQAVLTTEGHILTLDSHLLKPLSPAKRKLRRVENLQCPAYEPPILVSDEGHLHFDSGLTGGILNRADVDYARELIGTGPTALEIQAWSSSGWCYIPKKEPYSYDFVLSWNGQVVPEDLHPGVDKVVAVADGFVVANVTGLRVHVVSRLDGKGYDITKLGPFSVKTGQKVWINDTQLNFGPPPKPAEETKRKKEIELHFYLDYVDPLFQSMGMMDIITEESMKASTALFGGDPAVPAGESHLRFGRGEGVRVTREQDNELGCRPYTSRYDGDAVVVKRGDCTFLEKLSYAQRAGASGVVVLGDEDHFIHPSLGQGDAPGSEINDVALVVVRRPDAEVLAAMLDSAEMLGMGELRLVVEPWEGPAAAPREAKPKDPNRVLYLNNLPLMNTRLLV